NPGTSLTVTANGGSLVQMGLMDNGFASANFAETLTGQADDVFQITDTTGKTPTSNTNLTLNTATLDLNGQPSTTVKTLSGNGVTQDGRLGTVSTLTVGANNGNGATFSGIIQNSLGTVAVTKTGTGTQTLSGLNTYSGATTIAGGTLRV